MSGGVEEAGFFGGALGAAFFALRFSSCAARRAVPRSAVISPMPSIRRYFISCLLFECSEAGSLLGPAIGRPQSRTSAWRCPPAPQQQHHSSNYSRCLLWPSRDRFEIPNQDGAILAC